MSAAVPAQATLLWFRRDLRLTDNPALAAALARGGPLIPVYILDDVDAGAWADGGASRWWLHGSLAALATALAERGSRLVLGRGAADVQIERWIEATGATAIYWNRRYEPWAVARDARIKSTLQARGIEVRSFNAALLAEPWTLATQAGQPYRVYTPFWKALQARLPGSTASPAPLRLAAPRAFPPGLELEQLALRPTRPDWAAGLRSSWDPGETGAGARLRAFIEGPIAGYAERRNAPGTHGTSRLSPHLHFGEISPQQVWRACRTEGGVATPATAGAQVFLAEIGWREFCHHLLYHYPTLPEAPLRSEFAAFPWATDPAALRRWQRGQTGFPIVDAGMRELWNTGWMHNRVRMIVASFLVKDLLLDWRAGEAWFWDTLVDADLASNAGGWQWAAGCGADAAPYFRVFNPALQSARFDPEGHYIRRWVPEIAALPDALLHEPAAARPVDLLAAGIRLGRDYPLPIVDHAAARKRALAAFRQLRGAASGPP